MQALIRSKLDRHPWSSIGITAPSHKAVRVLRCMADMWGIGGRVEPVTIYTCLGLKPDIGEDGEKTLVQVRDSTIH
jgi:hypothetical protein